MKRYVQSILIIMVILFAATGFCAEDITNAGGTAPVFFQQLQSEGLIGVERIVHTLYSEFDAKKQDVVVLRNIAGVDMAAHLYLANLDDHDRKLLPKYEYWSQPVIKARLDKRLKRFFKKPEERESLMLNWLKTTKAAMAEYYKESNAQ